MSEIKILLEWLEIKKTYSSDFPTSLENLKLNIMKSSLLKRMLEGKEPLHLPPPTSYSHPWYSLIEDGSSVIRFEEFFFPEGWQKEFYNYEYVMIRQTAWEVLSVENNIYKITYHYQCFGNDARSLDEWSFSKIDENNENWILKKL